MNAFSVLTPSAVSVQQTQKARVRLANVMLTVTLRKAAETAPVMQTTIDQAAILPSPV
jgi:hypothetical protein